MNLGDPKTLRKCTVCLDITKRSHLNYGGDACFSCRAFFRRAHQKFPTSVPNFQCKNASQCQINAKNRRRCQKCRYDRCLEHGMKPSCVLDEIQRKTRFRKPFVRKKPRRKMKKEPLTDSDLQDQDQALLESLDQGEFDFEQVFDTMFSSLDRPDQAVTRELANPSDTKPDESSRPSTDNVQGVKLEGFQDIFDVINVLKENSVPKAFPQVDPQGSHQPWDLQMLQHLWSNSFSCYAYEYQFLQAILHFHHNGPPPMECILQRYFSILANFFWHHSFSLQGLRFSFSQDDLSRLVERNTQLFLHLILGHYVAHQERGGKAQIEWLLMLELPSYLTVPPGQVGQLESHFQSLFGTNCDFKEYQRLCQSLSGSSLGVQELFALSALILLKSNITLFLDQFDQVEIQFKGLFDQLSQAHKDGDSSQWARDISKCLDTLQTMADEFPINLTSPEANPLTKRELSVPFSSEEENWTLLQFNKFDNAFRNVSFGAELLKEYIMYSFDVPLSRHFMPQSILVMAERFHKIFLLHHDFLDLSHEDHKIIWRYNLYYGVALYSAKCESFETGEQQLRFSLGKTDGIVYQSDYSSLVEQGKIKKVTMADINEKNPIMSVETCSKFVTLVEALGALIRDTDSFKLFSLVAVFSPDGLQSSTVKGLQSQYITLLQRRIQHKNHWNSRACERQMNEFCEAMTKIRQVADILRDLKSTKEQQTLDGDTAA